MKKLLAALLLAIAAPLGADPDINPKAMRASVNRAFAPLLMQLSGAYAEDSAHVSGHFGSMVLGVRRDTPTSLAGTDGDYMPPTFNSSGALWVAGNGTFTVSGTVTANAGTGTFATDPTDEDARVLGRVKVHDGTDTALVSAAGALLTDGSATTQPVSGTVTANQGSAGTAWEQVGDVAHDAPATTVNPLLLGGYASAAAPTDVSLDTDAVRAWMLRNGSIVVNLATGGTLYDARGITSFPDNEPFNLAQLGGTALSGANVVDAGNTAFRVNCVTGCVAGGSFADASAFTFGTTAVSNTAFVVDDTATNTVAENSAGAARMNTNRILYSMNTNSTGGEVGTAGTPFRVDPTGSTTQPVSGTVTANAGTGNFNVVGTKSNNGGVPGATNLGTLPAVANAAAPTHTETNQVALRVQLDGDLVTVMEDELPAGTQNIGDVDVLTLPAVTGGKSDNGGAPGATNLGTLPAVALAADPTRTEGNQVALRTQLDGDLVTAMVDELPAGTQNIGDVDVATIAAGDNNIGNVDIVTFPDNEPFNLNQRGGVAVVAGACERESLLYIQISQTAGAQLITGTASERIYICSFQIITATAQNIALVDGTGSVCATSPTGLLGGSTAATGWNFAANGGIVLPPTRDSWTKTSTDSDNVCLIQSGAGQVSGSLSYISIPNI